MWLQCPLPPAHCGVPRTALAHETRFLSTRHMVLFLFWDHHHPTCSGQRGSTWPHRRPPGPSQPLSLSEGQSRTVPSPDGRGLWEAGLSLCTGQRGAVHHTLGRGTFSRQDVASRTVQGTADSDCEETSRDWPSRSSGNRKKRTFPTDAGPQEPQVGSAASPPCCPRPGHAVLPGHLLGGVASSRWAKKRERLEDPSTLLLAASHLQLVDS